MTYDTGLFLVVSIGLLAAFGLAGLMIVLRAEARDREAGGAFEGASSSAEAADLPGGYLTPRRAVRRSRSMHPTVAPPPSRSGHRRH